MYNKFHTRNHSYNVKKHDVILMLRDDEVSRHNLIAATHENVNLIGEI